MNNYYNWLPRARLKLISFSQNWVTVLLEDTLGADGKTVQKWVLWGIPQEALTKFMTLFDAARSALQAAMNKETRTEPVNEACRVAFDALEACMRMMKDVYFRSPPLTSVDMISLALHVKDDVRTIHGAPTGLCAIAAGNPQPGRVVFHFKPFNEEAANDKNAERICYRYGVLPRGGVKPEQAAGDFFLSKVPVSPMELYEVKTTRRKSEKVDFPLWYKGMSVFVSCRYENSKGDPGPWSEIIEVIIT